MPLPVYTTRPAEAARISCPNCPYKSIPPLGTVCGAPDRSVGQFHPGAATPGAAALGARRVGAFDGGSTRAGLDVATAERRGVKTSVCPTLIRKSLPILFQRARSRKSRPYRQAML